MKKWISTLAKILVSGVLIAILVTVGVREHVGEQLTHASRWWVAGGAGLLAAAWIINSGRWGLLLRAAGVKESPGVLISLYYIGMFFSQLLPTGAGGDAVRMWAISKRHGKPAAAIIATFQERLVGMGMSCLLGMCVGIFYFNRLPPNARVWMVIFQALMVTVVAVGLYPRLPLALAALFWDLAGKAISLEALGESKIGRKLAGAFSHVANLPPLTAGRLLPILLVGLGGILLSIGEWWAMGRAVGIDLPYTVYCLVVPLVWIISMLPSVGGMGVREGGFVYLMSLFGVAKSPALAVAALYLIAQTLLAGVGGLLLLAAVLTGQWSAVKSKPEEKSKPGVTHEPPGLL